jgi:gamma-glutamyltranspeptidase/glutathione hydrolase
MSMDEAIEAPRVHCMGKTLHVESRIPGDVLDTLKSMGHEVRVRGAYDNYFGGAQGILVDPVTGKLHGGADSRRDGMAIGY